MCFPLMNSDTIGQAEHALSVTSLPADLPDPWEQQAVFVMPQVKGEVLNACYLKTE